jgi:septum formation protein
MGLQRGTLVLASQSAARASVLRDAGLEFEVRPAQVDEAAVKAAGAEAGAEAGDVALTLAGLKAARVRAPGAVVIGADQVLECEGRCFDKPESVGAARTQLLALRGRRHELATAVVCMRDGVEIWRHVARPMLTMRPFSEAFLDGYLDLEGERVMTSVGAYRLEGPGVQLFDRVEGEHSAILGLPLLPLLGFLRQVGVLAE